MLTGKVLSELTMQELSAEYSALQRKAATIRMATRSPIVLQQIGMMLADYEYEIALRRDKEFQAFKDSHGDDMNDLINIS